MESIIQPSDIVAGTRERLDEIRASINDLVERRQNLMITTLAELAVCGINARIARETHGRVPSIGTTGFLVERVVARHGRVEHELDIHPGYPAHGRLPGPYTGTLEKQFFIDWGQHEVILVDDDKSYLVVPILTPEAEEVGHRRSVGRLRNMAKTEGMSVRVRGLDVTLIDPFNNVAHEGDIITAFAWLHGIDYTAGADSPVEQARLKSGMPLVRLEQLSGVPHATLRQEITHPGTLTLEELHRVSAALDADAGELFTQIVRGGE